MFEVHGLSDDRLIEVLLDAEQRIAAAQAEQLIAVTEIIGRCPAWMTAAAPGCPGLHPIEVTAAEIGPALRISKRAATFLTETALDASERLPRSLAALADGRLSMGKLRTLLDHTTPLSPEATAAVEDAVLARAATDTPSAFGARVRRAVIVADPAAARERLRTAVRERRVDLFPDEDGMAVLRALLPAPQALRAYRLLTAAATAVADEDGEDRDIHARRADTLLELIELLDAADQAGDAAPETETACSDRLAKAAVDTPVAPSSGPADVGPDGEPNTASPARPGRPAEPGRPTGPVGRARWGSQPVSLHVTVPWTALVGLSDEPGELDGYGALNADVVRELAKDATWRRVLTDPPSGAVLDVGTVSYHPPAGLDSFVRLRDRTCRFPGCRQPASRADLDHTEPFPVGPTADRNLAALCRPHHRIKTLTSWQVEQLGGGRLRWTSPTGRIYPTDPPPAHPPDAEDHDCDERPPELEAETGGGLPVEEDEPPF